MPQSQFLNVDLEIGAKGDLGALVEELSSQLLVLFTGKLGGLTRAHYEVTGQTKTADATIRELVRVLGRLGPAAKRVWRKARVRDFNIGIQCEAEPRSFELAIEAATLAQVAKLGGRIAVTVYPPVAPAKKPRKATRRT